MSKVKFIEDLTLGDLPDSVDDDVSALTKTAQTLSGDKVFEVVVVSSASASDLASAADDELITQEHLTEHINALKAAASKDVVSAEPIEVLPGGTYYYYQPGSGDIGAIIKHNPNLPGACPFDVWNYNKTRCQVIHQGNSCMLVCQIE